MNDIPEPGNWFLIDTDSFFIFQKSNRYKLINGCYQLCNVNLLVKYQHKPIDSFYYKNRWVIGDHSCIYNAKSPLLRCAVNPVGPCIDYAEVSTDL